MVSRSFFAIDNDNLVVISSPNGALVGNGIINNSDTPDGTVFLFSGGGGTTVTLDDTSGNPDTFEDDQEAGHIITDGGGIVANGQNVESESIINLRALDAGGTPTGPVVSITVLSQNGNFGDVWGLTLTDRLEDGVSYVKVSGSNFGSSDYDDFITCFGPATQIRTPTGETAIEDLRVGDAVWTQSDGFQPIRWIGQTAVPATGAFAPVVIPAGVLGNTDALTVSQEHRILLSDGHAELLFGECEVLVAAKHLVGLWGIELAYGDTVRYTHIMFDRHQIVSSNGVLSESFFLSANSVKGVEAPQRRELLSLFSSLPVGMSSFGETAALTLKRHEATLLIAQLQKSQRTYIFPLRHAA